MSSTASAKRSAPPEQPDAASRAGDRRHFLQAVGVLAAGGLAGAKAPPNRDRPKELTEEVDTTLVDDVEKITDAHIHIWTPNTERYPLAAGYRREEMVPASFTPQQFWAEAEPAGVRRVVLVQMSFYGFDNRYLLEAMAAAPERVGGIAVIDDDTEKPDDEMRRLAAQGVRGFRIYPRNRPADNWLSGPGMERMWRCGSETGLAMCHLINPDVLPVVDRMCERFPDTPVVIDHLARIGIDGQVRPADVEALCRLARHRQTTVKVSAFYALGRKQPPYDDLIPLVRQVYEAFGPERLMWGSDCPYQVAQQRYQESLDFVRQRLDFLSANDRQWMLSRTAGKLFFG